MLVMLKMSVPPLLFLCRWIMWPQNIVWTSYRSLKCQKKTRSKMFLGLKVKVLFSEWAFPCHAAGSGSALMVFCEASAEPWISSGSVGAFCESGGRCEWVWWGSSSQPSLTAILSIGAGCPRLWGFIAHSHKLSCALQFIYSLLPAREWQQSVHSAWLWGSGILLNPFFYASVK